MNLPMQSYKIFIGITITILSLLALILNGNNTRYSSESKDAISTNNSKKTIADQRAVQLYKLQQNELKVAIKAYFDKAIASGVIVGAGVSIVRGDSIVISDGFGKRNINVNKGVDGQTIFRLGSLSKGFAGILAANLKSEGKLDWEDKVSDYIPEFQLGDRSNTAKITLANILSHTSGAPYHSYTNLVEAGLPLSDIAKRFKEVTPISNPGLMYSYQNALFALSGEMMYKATGQEITTSLENRFFKPLEMCSTTMDYESLAHEKNVAIPHSKRRNRWKPKKLNNSYYNAIAAGGINASAIDMARWMRFLLGHNPEIMSKSALKEAFNPIVEIKGHSKYYQRWPGHVSSHYGFGWRIHKFSEEETGLQKTIWHHGGSVNNYRNEIAVYPESDLGICVLLNNNSKLAKTLVPDLYKIVKEVYDQTTHKIALTGVSKTIPAL
ncbi:serine hydrolase domain-containing protein [Eudoraea sp.]|uniref:serine hydrolase domain-containing protein n=1 Tax=Eudoraea sp. TaxID=1979955 RepID=UPI003C77BC7B